MFDPLNVEKGIWLIRSFAKRHHLAHPSELMESSNNFPGQYGVGVEWKQINQEPIRTAVLCSSITAADDIAEIRRRIKEEWGIQ